MNLDIWYIKNKYLDFKKLTMKQFITGLKEISIILSVV